MYVKTLSPSARLSCANLPNTQPPNMPVCVCVITIYTYHSSGIFEDLYPTFIVQVLYGTSNNMRIQLLQGSLSMLIYSMKSNRIDAAVIHIQYSQIRFMPKCNNTICEICSETAGAFFAVYCR